MTPEPNRTGDRPRKPERRPRPVTAEWLVRAGAYYLSRYASSSENLRQVLQRKVTRRVADWEEEPDEAAAALHRGMIDAAVSHFLELRLLDDRAFAEARFASLRRRGTSLRQAGAKLSQKGVERAMVETVAAGDTAGDLAAAFVYARRRRFGAHRAKDRAERRDRDIAAMMRAGFSFADARAAIDAEPEDEPGDLS